MDAGKSGLLLTPVLLGFIIGGVLGGRRAGRTGNPYPFRWRGRR